MRNGCYRGLNRGFDGSERPRGTKLSQEKLLRYQAVGKSGPPCKTSGTTLAEGHRPRQQQKPPGACSASPQLTHCHTRACGLDLPPSLLQGSSDSPSDGAGGCGVGNCDICSAFPDQERCGAHSPSRRGIHSHM